MFKSTKKAMEHASSNHQKVTTLYTAIKDEWAKAGSDIPTPPHLMAHENRARMLDARFAILVKPHVDMWLDGHISTAELFEQMASHASTEVTDQ